MSMLGCPWKQPVLEDFKANNTLTMAEIPVSEDDTTCSDGSVVAECDIHRMRRGDGDLVWQNRLSTRVSDKSSEAESEDSVPAFVMASAALASAELKSVGSANHRNGTCVECQFYFFSQKGCAKGADCLFCHEVHARKKKKQLRKIMKRMALDGIHADKHRASSTTSTCMPAPHICSEQAARVWSIPSIQLNYSAIIPCTTYIVGQRVHVMPCVERIYAESDGLQLAPIYTVQPPLPEGLCVEADTGLICGVPVHPRKRCEYNILASAIIGEASGQACSSIVLAHTKITIQIVDIGNDWVSQVAYAGDDYEETFITVSL